MMYRISHQKRNTVRKAAALFLGTACLSAELLSFAAYAKSSGAQVEEKLYLNLDYYGEIDKANVVKAIQFTTADQYTDYGEYLEITNMSDEQDPSVSGDAVTWHRPAKQGKFYFQGQMDPDKIEIPWDFEVTYKVNGMVTAPEKVGGASGTVEIDIDAIPNKSVSEYMQNNMILMVLIPMDTSDVYSIDAPGSMEASFGNYSGIGFEALPGKEGHFEAHFGTDSFESMGVMMIMTPVTVSDLNKVKDLKEIKDRFRDDTDRVLDSVEAIMDNVVNMSSQLEETNQILDELASGKRKIDQNRTIIFNGIDVTLEDLRGLTALIAPVNESLETSRWMVTDLNDNLNRTSRALDDSSDEMSVLSRKLRSLEREMSSVNTFRIDSVSSDLAGTKKALQSLRTSLIRGGTAAENLKAITGDTTFQEDSESLLYEYVLSSSEYEEEYLPEAVIEVISRSVSDPSSMSASELQQLIPTIANLLDFYRVLSAAGQTDPTDTFTLEDVETEESGTLATNGNYVGDGTVSGRIRRSDDAAFRVSSSDLSSVIYGLTVYQQTGDATAAMTAIGSFLAKNGVDASMVTALSYRTLQRLGAAAADPSAASTAEASRFVHRLISMLRLKGSVSALEDNTGYGGAGTSLRKSLGDLSDYGSEALANAIYAYASVDYDTVLTDVDKLISSIDDVMDAGADVSYRASTLLDSIRDVITTMDELTNTLNYYEEDIQTAIVNVQNLLNQSERLASDLTGTAQVLNNTLRAASEDFSRAGDDSIALGREAVSNTGDMIENTRRMKEAGADLRKTINDKIDEEEEDNNFLNMDPDAVKESLTSTKNQEPESIQIICRTEEISKDDADTANASSALEDAEIPKEATTFGGRVVNIFRSLKNKILAIFGK